MGHSHHLPLIRKRRHDVEGLCLNQLAHIVPAQHGAVNGALEHAGGVVHGPARPVLSEQADHGFERELGGAFLLKPHADNSLAVPSFEAFEQLLDDGGGVRHLGKGGG